MLKYLKNSTKTYWLLVLVTIIPFLFSLIWQRQREEDFLFIFINAAILLLPLYFIKNHKWYIILIFPFLIFPAFFDFAHIFLYQGRITESIFFIIFDTNPAESAEYIESNLSFSLIGSSLLYLGGMIFYWLKVIKFEKITISTKLWKYLLLWILLPFVGKLSSSNWDIDKTVEAYRRANHFYSMTHYFMGYREQMKRFKSFASNQKQNFKIIRRDGVPKKETYVLILGESTTSTKMQVYGYQRENTPNLVKLKNNGEITIFNDVVSSDPPGTMANLKKILTLANTEKETAELVGTNIVNIMKASGFKTYWVSNQLILGTHDTTTTVFAKQADRVSFTNTTNSVSYDEKILPILDDYLIEDVDKKFIVIHLIGTHMKYRHRFPSEFEKFKDDTGIIKREFHNKKKIEYINDYDNSILYHDHILNEVLLRLKKSKVFSKALFLSDHGEEVYDLKNLHGHPGTAKTINMYRIPFFIWESENRDLSKYVDRKYVSDDVIHTMFGLFGIETSMRKLEKSVITDQFVEKPRYMGNNRI